MVDSVADIYTYRRTIEQLRFGKRVGAFLYLHIDGFEATPKPVQSIIEFGAELARIDSFIFNIVKLGARQLSLTLLNYPGFWRQPFPVLEQSAKLDLQAQVLHVTDYRKRANRPVLHRKELLLPPGHSHYQKFADLTAQAEALGLFKEVSTIGLTKGWRRELAKSGVKIVGHTLRLKTAAASPSADAPPVSIERHKSAMRRQHLSQPLQAIQKYGYLSGSFTIMDYGCGRGDDVFLLQKMSVTAHGWDPYFHSTGKKERADIVNLGFVINVIENRPERDLAVKESFDLAKKFVVVSALIGNPEYSGPITSHSDGVVTSIGTFQKYFLPDELENYVRELVRSPVISISQGVVLAFKNEDEADQFRALRAGSVHGPRRGSIRQAEELFLLDTSARDVLAAFWNKCVSLGREPLATELDESEMVQALGLSPSTAFKYLSERLGVEDVEDAAMLRREELLVEFALGHFDGRIYYKYLSESVQKDIASLFGCYKSLRDQSRELLYSISNTELLMQACSHSASEGCGYLLTDELTSAPCFAGCTSSIHSAGVRRLCGAQGRRLWAREPCEDTH
jgi:DNA phosphorothioation-associated putative methyltransferase